MFKPVFLSTDIAFFALLALLLASARYAYQTPDLRAKWQRVWQTGYAASAAVMMVFCLSLALLDSLHFRLALPQAASSKALAYSPQTLSVLDLILAAPKDAKEKSYSEPFASVGLLKESWSVNGQTVRDYPPLQFAGKGLRAAQANGELPSDLVAADIAKRTVHGAAWGFFIAAVFMGLIAAMAGATQQQSLSAAAKALWARAASRRALCTVIALSLLSCIAWQLAQAWHIFGTTRAGLDVFYLCVKSIRTAVMIGLITTLFTLPFALLLGLLAGYLRGWVDEVIQYLYTVLSSIPGVLLIAALVLMIQVFIDANTARFETALQRADIKLFLLCAVLGLTGWAGLARLLRAESLKLRELEFVQAAQAFGVPTWRVMLNHLLPNVLHLVVLTAALEFSGLVLYEAVLSYIGVGVDPSIQSFGGMLDTGRSELARTPVIWWPLAGAFIFMLAIVLAVNIFADALQEAFDPRNANRGAKP